MPNDSDETAFQPRDADSNGAQVGSAVSDVAPSRGQRLVPVVGLGGSAGSFGPLRTFLSNVPPDSGMAYVVIVHLAPEHESMLSELLQRATSMRVSEAQDNQALEANCVYVIPPGKQLSLSDGHLRLSELPREFGRRVAVDFFFRSLADTHGSHSTAVILSGADGDGAIGIKRIKERGGLTIAQDPEMAEQSGMPRSAISTGMVDWILDVAEMPRRIVEYQARESRLRMPPEEGPNPAILPRPSSLSEEAALRDVLMFLRTRTGRDFSYYKRATIVRRIARRMQVNEVDDLSGYLAYLRTHPGEAGALFQDLLISVTNFFRDKEAFEALERQLPQLFRGKTQTDTLRVWVPGCATGEEAYSLAMLLTEHAQLSDSAPAIQIFATDLNEDVILAARNGIYPDAIEADVSHDRLRRFFIKEHQGYRVRRDLREIILFAAHDLLKDSPFSRIDLISCRNLLIYLDRDAQQRAFEIFHFALRSEGSLFLGASESIDEDSQTFRAVDKKHRLFVKRPAIRSNLAVPAHVGVGPRAVGLNDPLESGSSTSTSVLGRASQSLPQLPTFAHDARSAWGELHFKLIERFGPPSLIVNEDQQILHLSASAGKFLQFTGGEPSMNLVRAVHPLLRVELRSALYRARQTGEPASAFRVPMQNGAVQSLVDIHVTPTQELAPDYYLVMFDAHETRDPVPLPRAEEDPAIWHLERELEYTKRHLRDLVEQHEASTEELKASNEELQAMNEELRSATEELETSREEQQSINEELTTVNQELKAKLDELGHANSDLHNLMGATAIATVFLDRELRIMRFTPSAIDLFNLIPTDLGRPLSDLRPKLSYPELMSDAASVLQQLVPIDREVAVTGGRSFLARVLPYRTIDDRIAGVVLTFVEVSDLHAARDALRVVQQQLEARVIERTAQVDSINLALRQEIIEHQRAERARQELQMRLVNAQEEERRRISLELHDEVGQQLTALMLSLKALEDGKTVPGEAEALRGVRQSAEHIAREIHQLALELRPLTLDDMGLPRALASYIESWSARAKVKVDLVCIGLEARRLPKTLETTLYRIVQEALNNVLKHAAATSVSVSIECHDGYVLGVVEDDGRGFDDGAVVDSSRIGIVGMRERATVLGGELTVETRPDHGTSVRARIPVVPLTNVNPT